MRTGGQIRCERVVRLGADTSGCVFETGKMGYMIIDQAQQCPCDAKRCHNLLSGARELLGRQTSCRFSLRRISLRYLHKGVERVKYMAWGQKPKIQEG